MHAGFDVVTRGEMNEKVVALALTISKQVNKEHDKQSHKFVQMNELMGKKPAEERDHKLGRRA